MLAHISNVRSWPEKTMCPPSCAEKRTKLTKTMKIKSFALIAGLVLATLLTGNARTTDRLLLNATTIPVLAWEMCANQV